MLSFQNLRLQTEIHSSSQALEHEIVQLESIIDSDVNKEKTALFHIDVNSTEFYILRQSSQRIINFYTNVM